jgi:hypothetical protein
VVALVVRLYKGIKLYIANKCVYARGQIYSSGDPRALKNMETVLVTTNLVYCSLSPSIAYGNKNNKQTFL